MPGFGSMAACDVSRDKALSLARWPLSIAYTSPIHTHTPHWHTHMHTSTDCELSFAAATKNRKSFLATFWMLLPQYGPPMWTTLAKAVFMPPATAAAAAVAAVAVSLVASCRGKAHIGWVFGGAHWLAGWGHAQNRVQWLAAVHEYPVRKWRGIGQTKQTIYVSVYTRDQSD